MKLCITLHAKGLEILKEAMPSMKKVAAFKGQNAGAKNRKAYSAPFRASQ
jgi:hypothetical protein